MLNVAAIEFGAAFLALFFSEHVVETALGADIVNIHFRWSKAHGSFFPSNRYSGVFPACAPRLPHLAETGSGRRESYSGGTSSI